MSRLVLAALVVFAGAPLAAQSVPDWAAPSQGTSVVHEAENLGPGPPPPPPPPPPVPLDGGLGLLALAGAGYAAHKLRRSQGD